MKILIAGCGKVGETLAEELSSEGHDLTLIDSDPQVLEFGVERYDIMAVQGNCASMEALRSAGAGKADLLIASTGSDELNLLSCLTAHGINPGLHTIARIRNPEYVEQAYSMKDTFALSMIFNPEQQAAVEISRLLKYPGFFKRDSFAKGKVEIVELRIEEDSKLRDIPLSILYSIIKCRVLVCAVLRDGKVITPDGTFVLLEGDRIFVTASSDDLSTLLKSLDIVKRRNHRVMIAGGGKISYYLAEQLEKSGMSIQIVENDPERCLELAAALPHTSVINGDVTNHTLLESEGIGSCDAFVSLTGTDELNVMASIYGDSKGVPQIITKLGRLEDSQLVEKLPIGSVISPRKLCCNNIVRYVRAMQHQSGAAITIHTIADGQAEAIEFPVDGTTLHCGEPLKKIRIRKNTLIVGISRGDSTVIPNGDSSFRLGDSVVVVVGDGEKPLHLNDIFE